MIRYCPVPSVVPERVLSISAGLAASTVTPGSTAPDGSRTVPVRTACAKTVPGRRRTARIARPFVETRMIDVLFRTLGPKRREVTNVSTACIHDTHGRHAERRIFRRSAKSQRLSDRASRRSAVRRPLHTKTWIRQSAAAIRLMMYHHGVSLGFGL